MKLDKQDLKELVKRVELVNSYQLTAQALEMQKQMWLGSLFEKYGIAKDKKYTFDLIKGVITESK